MRNERSSAVYGYMATSSVEGSPIRAESFTDTDPGTCQDTVLAGADFH